MHAHSRMRPHMPSHVRQVPLAFVMIGLVLVSLGASSFIYSDTNTHRETDTLTSQQPSKAYSIDFCLAGEVRYARSQSSLPLILAVGPLENVKLKLMQNSAKMTDFDVVRIGEFNSIDNIPMAVEEYGVVVIRPDHLLADITYALRYQYTCHPFIRDAWALVGIGVGLLSAAILQKYRESTQRTHGQTIPKRELRKRSSKR